MVPCPLEEKKTMYNPVFHVTMESFTTLPILSTTASHPSLLLSSVGNVRPSVPDPCWCPVLSILNSESLPTPLHLCFKTFLFLWNTLNSEANFYLGPPTFYSPLLAFSFIMSQLESGERCTCLLFEYSV